MNKSYFIFDSNIQNDRKLRIKNIKEEMSSLPFFESETIMISSIIKLKKSLLNFKLLKFKPDVRLGAAGLLLGTIKLYERALDKNIDQLIVFEDDFIIGQGFYKNLLSVLEERKSFDVISLYAHINSSETLDLLENNNINSLTIKSEEYSVIPKLFSYVISSQGMKKFLDYAYSTPLDPIDVALFDSPIPGIDNYVINPKLISMGTIDNIIESGHAIEGLSNISKTKFVGNQWS